MGPPVVLAGLRAVPVVKAVGAAAQVAPGAAVSVPVIAGVACVQVAVMAVTSVPVVLPWTAPHWYKAVPVPMLPSAVQVAVRTEPELPATYQRVVVSVTVVVEV